MNNYKTYFKIALKYLGISVMYMFIFWGIAMLLAVNGKSNTAEAYKSEKVDIAVFDRDQSEFSKALYQYLDETQNIIELEDDKEIWKDDMYTHKVECILIIPEDFEEKILEGDTEEGLISYETPGSKYSMFVEMKINGFLRTFQTYLNLGKDISEAYQLTSDTLNEKVEVSLKDQSEGTGETLPASCYYFQYIAYIMPCMTLLGIAPCIKAFRRKEIVKRTFCSSTSYLKQNIELTLAALLHSMIFMAVLLVVGLFMSEKLSMPQILLYAGNLIVHTAACLCLAFAVSNFVFSENLINMIANVFGLASSFLCGVFVPREYLPEMVDMIGHGFPAYWYINLNQIIYTWKGSKEQISIALCALGMQILFGVAYLCLGFAFGKIKKKS